MKAPVCLECGQTAKVDTSRTVYPYAPQFWNRTIYLCECGAYVGCHPGTTKPLGRPAGVVTRRARIEAHAAFDALWRRKVIRDGCSKSKARKAGYAWLAEQLAMEKRDCHISLMDAATARRVVEVCRNLKGETK